MKKAFFVLNCVSTFNNPWISSKILLQREMYTTSGGLCDTERMTYMYITESNVFHFPKSFSFRIKCKISVTHKRK